MKPSRIAELRDLAATGKQGPKSAAIVELCDALEARHRRQASPKFALSDVMKEAERMHWPPGLAEQCNDTYERVGWKSGKNAIVSLPAAMRTWKRNHDKWNGVPGGGKTGSIGSRYGVG